ncbi:MAG: ABC transporter substrate-binding protein [Methanopyri archaeon]|nr:ABC transporter substrate-binding protein [Methanopyri archaeon]
MGTTSRPIVMLIAGIVCLLALAAVLAPPNAGTSARFVRLRPALMEAALARGDVAAFVAWEPHCARAVLSGTARVLAASKDIWPSHPCCVLAARQELLESRPGLASTLRRVHERATAYMNEHPDETADIFAAATGMDRKAVQAAMDNIAFRTEPDREGMTTYMQAIRDAGLVPPETDPTTAISGMVPEHQEVDTPTGPITLRVGWLEGDIHQAAFLVAEEKGYFADEGITIEEVVFENGVKEMDGFAAADIDAGYLGAAPLLLKGTVAQVPVVVIAGVNEEGSCIAVRADGPITEVSDLTGRDIAIPGFGTVQHVLVLRALEAAGVAVEGEA